MMNKYILNILKSKDKYLFINMGIGDWGLGLGIGDWAKFLLKIILYETKNFIKEEWYHLKIV